jgi:hypothetical protein
LFTRREQGSKTTIEGDAKVITVDYSNKESIKSALSGVDVVICTLSGMALGLQAEIAEAAIEAGVKLFVPSEFGNSSEGETEGIWGKESGYPNSTEGCRYSLHHLLHGSLCGFHLGAVCVSLRLWAPVELKAYAPGSWASMSRVGK